MKKFLLSLAAVAMSVSFASAAVTTLDLNKVQADNIDGTYVAQAGNTGEHYELGALAIDGYVFSLSKTDQGAAVPCYYPGTTSTLRLYKTTVMTVTAPQGVKMGTITFDCKSVKGVDAGNKITASNGVVTVNGTKIVWNGTEAINSVTLTVPSAKGADGNNPNIQIKSIEIDTDVTSAPTQPEGPATFEWSKAGMPETGATYVMVADGKMGAVIGKDLTYGRLNLTDVTIANDAFETSSTNGIIFTNTDKGWTMKDSYDRYLAMDDSHFTSFQLYTELNDGCYWTITEEADGVKIVNALNTDCFVCVSQGNEGTWYTNISVAKSPSPFLLPVLYKQGKQIGGGTGPATPTFTELTFVKNAEGLAEGLVVFVIDGQMGTPINKDYNYGRLTLADVTIANDKITCSSENAIDVTKSDKGYILKDAYGRYLAMDATHTTSFQLYTELQDGCYWTQTVEADGVKLTNTLVEGSVVCQSMGTESWYTNIAPAVSPAEFKLPVVYVDDKAAVAAVDADLNAPVEYFDLQGRRIANPEKGLFIKKQGAKATKVIIR